MVGSCGKGTNHGFPGSNSFVLALLAGTLYIILLVWKAIRNSWELK